MNAMVDVKDALFQKVAHLQSLNVPEWQIAQSCGITPARVSQIVGTDEFKQKLILIQSENIEKQQLLNRGWDAVEEEAVGSVLETLQKNPDPDFALKAASVANKAVRRGHFGNKPINGNSNVTAVIQLNATFVEKLQMMNSGPNAIQENAKKVDQLPIADVESMLRSDNSNDIINIFNSDNLTTDDD